MNYALALINYDDVDNRGNPKTKYIALHCIKERNMGIGLYRGEKRDLEGESNRRCP